jgi:hypothetical protein
MWPSIPSPNKLSVMPLNSLSLSHLAEIVSQPAYRHQVVHNLPVGVRTEVPTESTHCAIRYIYPMWPSRFQRSGRKENNQKSTSYIYIYISVLLFWSLSTSFPSHHTPMHKDKKYCKVLLFLPPPSPGSSTSASG